MATQSMPQEAERPNGPVAAVMLGGGIGAAVLGIVTTLAAASASFSTSLNWYNPVGPLTGKSLLGVGAFLASWAGLHFMYRAKNVNFSCVALIAFVLLAIGLLGTFPPFFDLFAPHT